MSTAADTTETPPTFDEAVRDYERAAAALETIDRDVAETNRAINKLYQQMQALQEKQRAARRELKRTHDATIDAAKREWPLPITCQNA